MTNLVTNGIDVMEGRGRAVLVATLAALVVGAVVVESKKAAPTGHSAASAADLFSYQVAQQWAEEAERRGVLPVPLRIRWSSTARPVSASPGVVLGGTTDTEWRETPLSGVSDDIVDLFTTLPHRQLVIIGGPGAGKTATSIMIALSVIRRRRSGDRVPVIVPAYLWTPRQESFDVFLSRYLQDEYPFLAGMAPDGVTLSETLIVAQLVLPIVDGLDELPFDQQARAVTELDRLSAVGQPLVLTCRSREYERIVKTQDAILSRAAVIELQDIEIEAVVAYLSHPGPSSERWKDVFEELRRNPQGPAARALSTPLLLTLAGYGYQQTSAEPSDLLRFATRSELTEHLINRFVRSQYESPRPRPMFKDGPPVRYAVDDAHRWLLTLAAQTRTHGFNSFEWWQLTVDPQTRRPIPRRLKRIALTVALALGAGSGAAISAITSTDHWPLIGSGSLYAFVSASLAIGRAYGDFWPTPYPPRRKHGSNSTDERFSRFMTGWPTLSWPLAIALYAGHVDRAEHSSAALLVTLFFACGPLSGLAVAYIPTWTPFRLKKHARSPLRPLRSSLTNALLAATQWGSIGTVLTLSILALTPSDVTFHSGVWWWAIGAGVWWAIGASFSTGALAWLRFRLAHWGLARRGLLPWKLSEFLSDATNRGVLRRTGSILQFRHALVQLQLARQAFSEASATPAPPERPIDEAVSRPATGTRPRDISELRSLAMADRDPFVHQYIEHLVATRDLDTLRHLSNRTPKKRLHRAAREQFAKLLAELGLFDELRERAYLMYGDTEGGPTFPLDEDSGYVYSSLAARRGDVEELRKLYRAGIGDSFRQLPALLAATNAHDELRELAASGSAEAMSHLADLLISDGELEEAAMILRELLEMTTVKRDYLRASVRLADILCDIGYVEDAIALLQASADAGDAEATNRLNDLT
ncbi:NACHT domain-containing protein [Micromonospora thermarum]|uniref:NACHT domain-containing protein n=1 Tax=Micromonospora thermarum TaxID=2720024 RepID=A0ABX0ZD95_9ACTN|nr:NACHT domain-containing protein [Micromonospora thermarum]NJP35199.1 NACHT domain-containing protein [Micromonospora thermarum]